MTAHLARPGRALAAAALLTLAACAGEGAPPGPAAPDLSVDAAYQSCGNVDFCLGFGISGFHQCSNMYISGVGLTYRNCIVREVLGGRCDTACQARPISSAECSDCLFGRCDGGAGCGGGACSAEHRACH